MIETQLNNLNGNKLPKFKNIGMRQFIFEFEQRTALELDLSLKDLLILDYMIKFFNSDSILRRRSGDDFYCRLTYKKILNDLPILHIKERQLRNIYSKLEKKGILERLSELKNQLYIKIDWDKVFGKKIPSNLEQSEIDFTEVGNGLLAIDNYDIKKIKIIHDNARVKNLDKNILLEEIKKSLKESISKISYEIGFEKITIDEITDKEIVFNVPSISFITNRFSEKFSNTIKEVLSKFTS